MFKHGYRCCCNIFSRFFADDYPIQAAGLGYVTLLSLVPLMTVSLSVISAFPMFKGLSNEIQEWLISNLVASSAHIIQHKLQTFVSQTSHLPATSMVFLLVMAILMIFSMEQAFNRIWRVSKRRNLIQAFLTYWAVLTLTPILIGFGLAITSYLLSFKLISGVVALPLIKRMVLIIAPYFFTFLAFTLLYVALPNCKVKIRYALIGAFVATILFELAKFGFAFYITHFSTYTLIYGALAALPLFLIWLYVSWLVVLFGAMVSYEIANFNKPPD